MTTTSTYKGKLTNTQTQHIQTTRNQWMTTALATHQPNRPTAETAVKHLYDAHQLPQPLLTIWMDSPFGCIYAAGIIKQLFKGQLGGQLRGQLRDQLRDQLGGQLRGQLRGQLWGQLRDQLRDQLRNQLGGQLGGQLWGQLRDQLRDQLGGQLGGQLGDQLGDQLRDQLRDQLGYSLDSWYEAYWLAFYGLALPIAGLPPEPKLGALTNLITEVGWLIPMRGAVILGGRPTTIHREADGALHCATGPALAWQDGYTLHAWHGRRVPAWVIEKPTVEAIAGEPNIEVRRCAVEVLGWERFTREANLQVVIPGTRGWTYNRAAADTEAAVPDPGNPGQHLVLYDVPEHLWGSRIRLLMCTNGSTERDGTRRRYGLTVPAEISDPVEAAAWTYNLTRDEYAATMRRT
jgi:hypothetical protein